MITVKHGSQGSALRKVEEDKLGVFKRNFLKMGLDTSLDKWIQKS